MKFIKNKCWPNYILQWDYRKQIEKCETLKEAIETFINIKENDCSRTTCNKQDVEEFMNTLI